MQAMDTMLPGSTEWRGKTIPMHAEPVITYTIAMPQPHTHLYYVSIDVPGVDGATVDFILPSWTPGSYMIREFARHVQEFSARTTAGDTLPWRKVAKDTWRVETQGATHIGISYKVYAYELTVRTSHLDSSHGYFNGATTFMYVPGRTREPLALEVQTPPGWKWQVTTGLEHRARFQANETPHDSDHKQAPDPDTWSFIARDYDELVDCPVECGTHRLLTFEVDGIEHRIAIWGQGNEDEQRLVADTQRIVEVQRELFGGLPYAHYTFILHLSDRYGGLEHRNSVTNSISRWSFQPEVAYQRFLELQSHELFHAWNVKRIRPAPLGPFDYRQENYTRLLWAMEGVTSYYDRLLLVRAELMSAERYLAMLADDILKIQATPGRRLHSIEESSFDAWIKFYRPDEQSDNSSISYYLKGGIVVLLLDLEIRQRTDGAVCFDDVLRYLYVTYPVSGLGISEDGGYLAAVEAVAGHADGAYHDFFARYVAGTEELDYTYGLGLVGLQPEWGYSQPARHRNPPAWLGAKLKMEQGRTLVSSVRSDSPAYISGLYAGDELLALNGFRVDEKLLQSRLNEHAPGDTVTLSLFRRDELLHVTVVLANAPYDTLQIKPIENPTPSQEKLCQAWVGKHMWRET